MSQTAELADPTLRSIAERVARQAELAIEKIAAHHVQPSLYPLPSDDRSIERILASRFAALPERIKQAAAAQALTRLDAAPDERAERYGDLARIDLTTSVAIDAQVAALPFPSALRFRADQIAALRGGAAPMSTRQLRQSLATALEFRIHKVTCVDETDGFLSTEAGDDEIHLAGMTVDETGDSEAIAAFPVRDDFDDGEQKVYSPPRLFASFDLSEGTEYPKSYFVTLVLAEADMGGLPEFLNKLVTWAKEKVTSYLATALGAAIGASGGPIGALIGAAVGAVVGAVFDFLVSIWEDDPFKPAVLSVSIPSLTARWAEGSVDSPPGAVTFRGHGGEYQVTYDWHLVAPPPAAPIENPAIYAVRENGDLLWYRHNGGTAWAAGSGNQVGNGWNFQHIFGARDGLIYGVQPLKLDPTTGRRTGERLLWYRHDGRANGTGVWAPASGREVGTRWRFKHVFAGEGGVIYAIRDDGDMLWYRHDGRDVGNSVWAANSGAKIGNGWNFSHVFSGGNGVIYAVERPGLDPRTGAHTGSHLLWYRHDGHATGTPAWAPASGKRVGSRWNFKHVLHRSGRDLRGNGNRRSPLVSSRRPRGRRHRVGRRLRRQGRLGLELQTRVLPQALIVEIGTTDGHD